jgi:hypothetical protein
MNFLDNQFRRNILNVKTGEKEPLQKFGRIPCLTSIEHFHLHSNEQLS